MKTLDPPGHQYHTWRYLSAPSATTGYISTDLGGPPGEMDRSRSSPQPRPHTDPRPDPQGNGPYIHPACGRLLRQRVPSGPPSSTPVWAAEMPSLEGYSPFRKKGAKYMRYYP